MRESRKYINPYLFLLLKRMLDYEFVRMGTEPSDYEMAKLIYDRYKDDAHKLSSYGDKSELRDPFAYSQAERIYSQILRKKSFKLSFEMLDYMVAEITVMDKITVPEGASLWEAFAKKYGNDKGALVAGRKYKDRETLNENEYQEVRGAAYMTLYKMHNLHKRRDKDNQHTIIEEGKENEENYIIRTANTEEIKDIETLADRIYPCPINRFDIKRPWHDKNPNIFFIYKDDLDLWANINLLPLKNDFYTAMKTGKIYENKITHHDIYSPAEKNKVDCIYVEGLACTLQHILPLFAKHFEMMVGTLANPNNKKLVICAIGGSDEGDLLMKNSGFERTGWAIDPKDGTQYPFLEISWKELKIRSARIDKFFASSIVSEERLTPYTYKASSPKKPPRKKS